MSTVSNAPHRALSLAMELFESSLTMKNQFWKSIILAAIFARSSFGSLGEEVPPLASASSSAAAEPTAFQTGRPNLTGSVHAKNGDAVAATVFIATAGPKVGTSPFCPSCYADCQ